MLRVGGMASGMDTESIVKDLMKAERMPLDKLKQKKQTLEWQRDQYREMNILLQDFRNLTSISGMLHTKNYRASAVTSSNESVVSATVSTAASQGSFSITSISSLAKAENWVSAAVTADTTQTFKAQGLTTGWKEGVAASQTITMPSTGSAKLTLGSGETIANTTGEQWEDMTVTVNGTAYTVVDPDGTAPTDGQVKINPSDGTLTFGGTAPAANASIKVNFVKTATAAGEKYTSFQIETKGSGATAAKETILVNDSENINQVINKVNSSSAGVSMLYDSFTKKISMMQKETGNFNSGGRNITITGDFATINILKLSTGDATATEGANAKFTINGLDTERPSNTFEMNGVTFTLKSTLNSGTASDAGAAVSVSVSKDTDTVYNNIKDFVEKYNTLIAAISAKTNEARYRSYTPLTDDQREQLSDKQQEQWEEKAKSGLLRRDTALTGVLSAMRSNFSQSVTNSNTNADYNQLAEIGITTTKNYREGGKLEIDETKLKKALAENPEAVEALFTGGSSKSPVSEQGIIHRLNATAKKTMDVLQERAGTTSSTNQKFAIGRQLSDVDDSITRFEDRLLQVEDRYWKQFTAMEKAMQNANSQSAYLMQQFSM
ncbi:hypothetical protein BA724_16070 [Domibacillus iocasae]|uniref:Flagellar hook-associated protein 2 n=1 Tax=Domibacillus iocasae TaxID=1714016 RepID=A0A1E7DSX9_9BACI|nr:hypothetical protein BA724_16070 [Domibacillus iocasae]